MNGVCFCVCAPDRVIVVPRQDRGQEVRGELWCVSAYASLSSRFITWNKSIFFIDQIPTAEKKKLRFFILFLNP